jgi:hypothetical protein
MQATTQTNTLQWFGIDKTSFQTLQHTHFLPGPVNALQAIVCETDILNVKITFLLHNHIPVKAIGASLSYQTAGP